MRKITYQQLVKLNACADQLALFKQTFGDSGVLTEDVARKYGHLFDVNWLADKVFSAPLLKEYLKKRDPLLKEYKTQHAQLWKEYNEKLDPLWKEYDVKNAQLWKEYNEKHAPLWEEFKTQCALLFVKLYSAN